MEDNNAELMEEFEDDISVDPYDNDAEWNEVKWDNDDEDENPEQEADSEGESDEADQPETDEAKKQGETETEASEEAADDTDQWIELKHMDDEPRKVSKEEAKALAQKGLDYDRIRQERDTLKSNLPRYEEMEKFLKEMQGDFETLEEFMDDTRARVKADAEGISYNEALQQVKAAKTPAQPQKEKDSDQADLNVDAFIQKYPNVKAEEIPASVWAEVRETGDLLKAYEKYDDSKKNDRIAELEREIETLKNNKKNADRSTGSSKSSGVTGNKSLIASMWDDDD